MIDVRRKARPWRAPAPFRGRRRILREPCIAAFTVLAFLTGAGPAPSASWAGEIRNPMDGGPTPGARVIDHARDHVGVDLDFEPDEPFPSPVEGTIERAEHGDASLKAAWPELVLRTRIDGQELLIRLLGVSPKIGRGATVRRGQVIGMVMDAWKAWDGLPSHVHMEVYRKGLRVDPFNWLYRLWPEDPPVQIVSPDWHGESKRRIFYRQAIQRRDATKPAEAIRAFEQSLQWPGWETTATDIYREIAFAAAMMGDFAKAARAQQTYLDLLRLELKYAEGAPPDPRLGPVGTAARPKSVRLQLERGAVNLRAYRTGKQAAIRDFHLSIGAVNRWFYTEKTK